MEKSAQFFRATWELMLIVGTIAVLAFALFILVRSIVKGGSIYNGIKKALVVLFRNLP